MRRAATLLLIAACGQPPPLTTTTRVCPAEAGSDPLCFRACPAQPPECTTTFAGAAVPECAKDGSTDTYILAAGEYVLPPGATHCVALLDDPDASSPDPADALPAACAEDGAILGLVVVSPTPVAEGECFDVSCRLSDDPDADCPDL